MNASNQHSPTSPTSLSNDDNNDDSSSSKSDKSDDDDDNDDDNGQVDDGDQRVIACLFNKGELKSVFNHDYAFNNTDVVTVSRLDREAREEAEELQKQLTASRRQYM